MIRALLAKYALSAKKSWGQHFLADERTYRSIVGACQLGREQWAIEIGAGLGTLTRLLAAHAGHVIAIERDRDLAGVLRAELGSAPGVEIAEANALTYDYSAAAARSAAPAVVVGNLPYQIASPLLFRVLEARRHLARIVVMLQKEVVDRILAEPATAAYGALSVMVRFYSEPKLVCRVGRGSFVPPPRVDSAVLSLTPFAGGRTRLAVADEAWFSRVVHAAFNPRRKMLRNSLEALAPPAALAEALAGAGIAPERRGETLTLEEFAALAGALWGARETARA